MKPGRKIGGAACFRQEVPIKDLHPNKTRTASTPRKKPAQESQVQISSLEQETGAGEKPWAGATPGEKNAGRTEKIYEEWGGPFSQKRKLISMTLWRELLIAPPPGKKSAGG